MSRTAPQILPLHHSFIRVIECILQIYIYGRCHIVDLCQRQMWFICDGKGWTFVGRICLYLLVLPFLFANLSPVRLMRSDAASDTPAFWLVWICCYCTKQKNQCSLWSVNLSCLHSSLYRKGKRFLPPPSRSPCIAAHVNDVHFLGLKEAASLHCHTGIPRF